MNAAWLPWLVLVVRPTVTSPSDCPAGRDIDSNLAVLLPAWAQPGTVTVSAAPDGLSIDLKPEDPAFAAQRSVVVGSNCEERAKAAAVVIATWWPVEPTGTRPGAEVSAVREERVRRFAVAASGYASIVSGSVAGGGRAEAAFLPWGRGLGVRLAAGGTVAHASTLDQGQVSWSRASLELGPSYAFRFLHVDAGLVGSLLWVAGSGFSENRKASGAAAGITAGARVALPGSRVVPWLELRGVAWPQSQQMNVTDSATGAQSSRSLPHAELQIGAGVRFSLF
jgi:hypothetical protein